MPPWLPELFHRQKGMGAEQGNEWIVSRSHAFRTLQLPQRRGIIGLTDVRFPHFKYPCQ